MTVTAVAKKKIINIALIVLSVMILLGVGLTVYLLNTDKSVIRVSVNPNEEQSVSFEELSLCPGESCSYTLVLDSDVSDRCQVTLNFDDQEPTQTLKQYAYIRMEQDGEVLCDELLATVFQRESTVLTMDFFDGAKREIKISYYIPEDVGNEAQNAEATFDLHIALTND